jgi:hypothetical protein
VPVASAVLIAGEQWVGPVQIRTLLERCLDERVMPPKTGSAYLLTQYGWRSRPSARCVPLYVGGTTGASDRFRTRIGDLLADMFGFPPHHSGGQQVYRWCVANEVNPLDLHLAWVKGTECHRCLEVRLHRLLAPSLNRMVPSRCAAHPQAPAGQVGTT